MEYIITIEKDDESDLISIISDNLNTAMEIAISYMHISKFVELCSRKNGEFIMFYRSGVGVRVNREICMNWSTDELERGNLK